MTQKEYNDYLAHHGILGQKWGSKNGPPYPLSGSEHSASEKKAGWRKSLSSSSPSRQSTNKKSSSKSYTMNKDTVKKVLKVGAAAAAVGLAAYGTYKLAKSGEIGKLASTGKKALEASKQLAKTTAKQAGKGIVEGIPEGAYAQGKRFGSVISGGITLLAAKELADLAAGGDSVDKVITAYNNYNKKNKVGNAKTNRREDDDDED